MADLFGTAFQKNAFQNNAFQIYAAGYNFGAMAESAVVGTGLGYFEVTNYSGFDIDLIISGTDMTGGNGWTLANDAVPGADIVGIKAGLEGGSYNVIVKKNTPYNTLKASLSPSSSQAFGLQMLAPTSFTDGVQKSGTVTITGVAS